MKKLEIWPLKRLGGIGNLLTVIVLTAVCSTLSCQAMAKVYQEPDDGLLVEHNHYENKAGQEVHSPAHSKSGVMPAGASAKCGDGSYSFSRTRNGTCSRHHGVAEWE
jgi:hypothetical protein